MFPNPSNRPELPLGAMTGDTAYVTGRSLALVETFGTMLDRPLQLVAAPGGSTDCRTFIRAPLHHPEGYLVVEHELSHCLFGTNLTLTKDAVTKIVERLFTRAGKAITQPELASYREKLSGLVHGLWNILEDHRCAGLWGQLYPEGARLLKQRWHDISQYDYEEDLCEKELPTFLARWAAGVDTPTAPDTFQRCKAPMTRAMNLVEGVDAPACLAITARLLDEIADELLDTYPPDKKQEAQQKMEQLAGMGGKPPPQKPEEDENAGLGDADLAPPLQPNGKPEELTAAQKNEVIRMLTARADDGNDEVSSSFSQMLQNGADRMEARIEQARAAMSLPKGTPEQKEEQELMAISQDAGIRSKILNPKQKLPPATRASGRLRAELDRVRMKMRRRLLQDGEEVDTEALIAAMLEDELDDAPLFETKKREGGLDLLLLVDVSGSMMGPGLALVDQAISDVHHACADERVRVHLWAFSDELYVFRKTGSVQTSDIAMGGTQMVQALEVAHQWCLQGRKERALVLITDGEPTSCRAKGSVGSPLGDLQAMLEEMERDRVVYSILAIGSPAMESRYEQVFGKGKYARVSSVVDMVVSLPQACKVLVEAHIQRTI